MGNNFFMKLHPVTDIIHNIYLIYFQEVGEESKLARSIERVRSLIRKKRNASKEKKANECSSRFEKIVREAQLKAVSVPQQTKLHRLSYQVIITM